MHPDDPAFGALPAAPPPISASGRASSASDLAYSAADADDEAEFDEDV
jgi:hypothetical protein